MNRFSKSFEKNMYWIFPLPAVIFTVVMIAFPVGYTIWISLTSMSMMSPNTVFVGLGNYLELFRDTRFLLSIARMMGFTVFVVLIETILGVALALILNKEFVGKGVIKACLLMPMIATPVAIGLVWSLFYEPTIGLANYMMKLFGLAPSKWLADEIMALPSIAFIDIWEWTPMIALICLSGLAGLSKEPFESALVDGARPYQVLLHVTLPMLKPTIAVAVMLRSIDAFKTYDIIYTLTNGGPGFASETLNIYAFNLSFGYFKFGYGAAALMVLFLIVLLGSVLMLLLGRDKDAAAERKRRKVQMREAKKSHAA